MKNIKPGKNALLSVRLVVLALALLVSVTVSLYIPVDIVVIITVIAVITIVIFLDVIYLPLYFANLRYVTNEDTITKYSGVIFKTNKTIKFSTVQYTTSITTPFSDITGLNFAILFVYGGQLRLLFLDSHDCSEIIRLCSSE